MRRFFLTILFWLVLIALGWLGGDRYGAPGWAAKTAAPAFGAIEGWLPVGADDAAGDDEEDAIPTRSVERSGADDPLTDSAAIEEEPAAPAPRSSEKASDDHAGIPQNVGLRINDAGLQIIKDSEGLRLESYALGGRDYIGYGHQLQPGEPRGPITEAEAERLLREDVKAAETGVRMLLTRPANENQFSAMVSLAYNKGVYGFAETGVLAKFNDGDIQGAADDFRNHTGRDGVIQHLVERREKERTLFLTPA